MVGDGDGFVVFSHLLPVVSEVKTGHGQDGSHDVVAAESHLHDCSPVELAHALFGGGAVSFRPNAS